MTPLRQLGTVGLRVALILAVAGLIVAGATAIGSSPLGARIPGTFFPFGAGGRGGPDAAVTTGAAPPAGQPTGAPPQAGRVRGGPEQQGGLFSGRNMPSLQRGWLEEVRYLALFALLTACVALALRVIRPRRRRPQGLRLARSATDQ